MSSERQEWRGHTETPGEVKPDTEMGMICSQAKGHLGHEEQDETKKESPPEPAEGAQPC